MKSKVYSFSAKSEEDVELVQQIKLRNMKIGKSFSWVVLQALKQMEEKRAHETRRER